MRSIHNRISKRIDMNIESIEEILFTVDFCLKYRKRDDPKKWTRPHNDLNGVLGHPSTILMLAIVDTIGSIYQNNKDIKIRLKDIGDVAIGESIKSHFYILNSDYFSQNLSKEDIDIIYGFRNNMHHNTILPENVLLSFSKQTPFIENFSFDSKPCLKIHLISFYEKCNDAYDLLRERIDNLKIQNEKIE